jgi:basic membrane protein A and related proteins
MKSKLGSIVALIMILSLVLVACGGAQEATQAPTAPPADQATATPRPTSPPGETVRVAFVYVAPVGDLGWTWAHDQRAG